MRKADWPRNDVDRFILAALEAKQLAPRRGPRETLIRRVTLDLTGLPPTPAEVDAFLADTSPDAYEKLVDRLLASPRYGEHMARYWLDVAALRRHARPPPRQLPRDVALPRLGDRRLQPQPAVRPVHHRAARRRPAAQRRRSSSRVATGFNRCNVTTSEGGAIDEEFHVRYAVDRVETTAAVWLGLTMGCAVCHDHKFDPITQKEFYQLFAFFNNIAEKADGRQRAAAAADDESPEPGPG